MFRAVTAASAREVFIFNSVTDCSLPFEGELASCGCSSVTLGSCLAVLEMPFYSSLLSLWFRGCPVATLASMGREENLRVPCKPCTAMHNHHHSLRSQNTSICGRPGTYSSRWCKGFGLCLSSVAGSVPVIEPAPLHLCLYFLSSSSSKEV